MVPSENQPQGEVQIVRRNRELLVRTLIASTVLKQVVAVIDAKEQRRWPETSGGFVSSQRYRDELYKATQRVWEQFRSRDDQSERHQALGIDFSAEHKRGRIELFAPQLDGTYGSLVLDRSEPLREWRVGGDYASQNMVAIIADSFNLDSQAAAVLLESYRSSD